MLASQVPVKDWHDVIGENRRQAESHQTCLYGRGAKEENKVKTIAHAILDRIVHRSPIVGRFGESIRKRKTKSENTYE